MSVFINAWETRGQNKEFAAIFDIRSRLGVIRAEAGFSKLPRLKIWYKRTNLSKTYWLRLRKVAS